MRYMIRQVERLRSHLDPTKLIPAEMVKPVPSARTETVPCREVSPP
jgi:hypothetical protein